MDTIFFILNYFRIKVTRNHTTKNHVTPILGQQFRHKQKQSLLL